MDAKKFEEIIFDEDECQPYEEEFVNVIINSILCGDINFNVKDEISKIGEHIKRIFELENFLRANYLIKKNNQDWDNFINEYPNCKSTEVSAFMKDHLSLALFIWLLNLRGLINLKDRGHLFTLQNGENGRIGISGFLSNNSDFELFVGMWNRLGRPKINGFNSDVQGCNINSIIDCLLVDYGLSIELINNGAVWNVCDFFGKVSTLIALKRPEPIKYEVYKTPILEVVGYLFPSFDQACALFYLKKCSPAKREDVRRLEAKHVRNSLMYYFNRKRFEPQNELKLYEPSVFKILKGNIHYRKIEFPKGTPLNWMPEESNIDNTSKSELFSIVKGLENYFAGACKKEPDETMNMLNFIPTEVCIDFSEPDSYVKNIESLAVENQTTDRGIVNGINSQDTTKETYGEETGSINNEDNYATIVEDDSEDKLTNSESLNGFVVPDSEYEDEENRSYCSDDEDESGNDSDDINPESEEREYPVNEEEEEEEYQPSESSDEDNESGDVSQSERNDTLKRKHDTSTQRKTSKRLHLSHDEAIDGTIESTELSNLQSTNPHQSIVEPGSLNKQKGKNNRKMKRNIKNQSSCDIIIGQILKIEAKIKRLDGRRLFLVKLLEKLSKASKD